MTAALATFMRTLAHIFPVLSRASQVWFLYEVLKVFPDCPYPSALSSLNKYSLILYVYHPLFLSFTSCYIIAYTTTIPCVLETAMLYFSALGGCYLFYFAIYTGGPWAKRLYAERSGQGAKDSELPQARDVERQPLLS